MKNFKIKCAGGGGNEAIVDLEQVVTTYFFIPAPAGGSPSLIDPDKPFIANPETVVLMEITLKNREHQFKFKTTIKEARLLNEELFRMTS